MLVQNISSLYRRSEKRLYFILVGIQLQSEFNVQHVSHGPQLFFNSIFFVLGYGQNINNLRYEEDITLMAESKELKSLSMKVKEENEKVGLKLNIQKMKIVASGPITSWEIDGQTVADFIFLGFKIIADGDSSHEIKRRLLLGRKLMTNLDSIVKRKTLLCHKGLSSQGYGFTSGHVVDVRVGL